MLFLGNMTDIIKYSKGYFDTVELLHSNTIQVSDCENINSVQLMPCTYDNINLEVYDKETTKDDIDNYTFPAIWTVFTVLKSNFENENLAAGNFDYMMEEVTSLVIKKRLANSVEAYLPIFEKPIYTNTNEFDFVFTDYLVKNNTEYEYVLIPILKNGEQGKTIPVAFEDDIKKLNFQGVFICEPDNSYSTFLNIEVTAKKEKPSSIITTQGRKYPFVLYNNANNYYTGTVKGLFVRHINDEFDFENAWDFREKLNDFLLNGKIKVLKYYDGRMWLVNVYDNILNEKDGHEYNINTTFSWAETGDINDVYTLYDNGFISYNPYTKKLYIADEEDNFNYDNVIYKATIKNNTGENLSEAKISLYRKGEENPIDITNSNSEGIFSFSGLIDGNYKIKILCNGYSEELLEFSVENHIVQGNEIITLKKIINMEGDERSYSGIIWDVLKSVNEDTNTFTEGSQLISDDILDSDIQTQEKDTSLTVILESDFTIYEGDVISISMGCGYEADNATDEELSQCACIPYAIAYTGISSEESIDEESNYHEFAKCSLQINFNSNSSNSQWANVSYTTTTEGFLKLLLHIEGTGATNAPVYPIINSINVQVNGRSVFKME